MKKYLLPVLTAALCLSATSAFAQAKKETTQEKIIRLEVENRVLNERVIALTQEIVSLQSQLAAAKAKDQPKKAEAPKADERVVLQARIVSLERQAAATQAHEQARLINRDTDFVSNINKHIPWTVKYIRGSEIRSMYEDNGHYYVNVEFDRKLSYVWIYEFTISGDFIDRYMAPQHISGRKVNLNFARIVK